MRMIKLTNGGVALVDDEDYSRAVSASNWRAHRTPRDGTTYVRSTRRIGGRLVFLHTFLTGFEVTDHRNGDGLDCRRPNMRAATRSENARNRRRSVANQSGFKGVRWHRQGRKWNARITVDGHEKSLGMYLSAEVAARAYDGAARAAFGEFAAVNFPRTEERGA